MEIPIYTSNDAPPLLSGLTDAVLTLMYTVTGPVVMDIPNDWEDLMAIIELPTAAAMGDPAGDCLPKDFRSNIVSKLQGNATNWRDDVGSYIMRPTADKIAGLKALRPLDNKVASARQSQRCTAQTSRRRSRRQRTRFTRRSVPTSEPYRTGPSTTPKCYAR